MSRTTRTWTVGLASAVLAGASVAQATQRVSVDSGGAQENLESLYPSISADGRFVVFMSEATNLVAGDTNGSRDVFVRDRATGTTVRASVDSSGVQGNGDSGGPSVDSISISADGRYVAFSSVATNLVPGDVNARRDVFVRDLQAGTTEIVSVDSLGVQGDDDSLDPSISADGRFVAFYSNATNLVAGDTNGCRDVFVRDRQSATTIRVSVDAGGIEGNAGSSYAAISADGRCVAFSSAASNLVPGDTNGAQDLFVRDLALGTIERVSVDSGGTEGNADSYYFPSLSSDGRFVAFGSNATNLVAGDTNGAYDVFVRDRLLGTTERASVSSLGIEGNLRSDRVSISGDGRFVAFQSSSTNLVPGDANGTYDVFLRDRQDGTTELASLDSAGNQGNGGSGEPSVSADGSCVAFYSTATNFVAGDSDLAGDVFVRLLHTAPFTSLCDAGVGGVVACPCANPPQGPDRGCDNSASTGGAALSGSGGAFLSSDSVVFTTTGEKPTATSVLLQGTSSLATGAVYGQGVRCVGGTLKRLYTRSASGGSITAPDLGAGDPTVSARSAAKGNPITAGESRWYLVFYRDPVVLGGCPASSTFNATQTRQVDWSF